MSKYNISTFQPITEQVLLCRFCAETKSNKELLSLSENQSVLNECLIIIEFFRLDFINLSYDGNMPQTICSVCYTQMQKAYSFFDMVRNSQVILSNKIMELKIECPDDNTTIENVTFPLPVDQDLKLKVQRLENPPSNVGIVQKCELKIENIDLPDLNTDSDTRVMYEGLDVFRQQESWRYYSWKCQMCPLRFTQICHLRSHSRGTHGTCNAFSCNDCTNTFGAFDEFINHIRSHRDYLKYFCKYCDCYNQTIEECVSHEETHSDYYHKCDLCGELFESVKLLSQHKKRGVTQLDNSDDSLSSIEFNDGSFQVPPKDCIIESWHDYPWICRYCNIAFKTIDYWRSHNKSEHRKCASYKCFDCDGYRPKKLCQLISHIRKHRLNLSMQCHICNETWKDEKSSDKHLFLHHYNRFSCEICEENFTDKDELNKHTQMYNKKQLRRSRPLTTDDLTCKTCKKVLKSRRHFWSHEAMHKKQIYPCDKCGKLFRNKNALDKHLSRYDKKYECDVCGRSFAQKIHVTKHLATHTDEKPFCCDVCGFKCRDIFKLRQHKLRHTTFAPFVCSVCSKAFKAAFYLKRHAVQHTGEKPYACRYCDRTFANVPNRHKHMKRIHGQLMILNKS